MAKLEIINVGKLYPGGVRAVQDASISIGDGELVVLVGPSGCGKSTLLRMVAGLEEISEGEVRIDGRVVNDLPPKDRDIAMVFQSYALYPHMTVYKNMGFALKMRGEARDTIDRKVRETAKLLGLEQLLERKPSALSGGQMQRVALGRAMVRSPRIFLFDEPLSNLDAKLRSEMRVELRRLHAGIGATMIYVTHDQVEAMTLGDRIVVMEKGLIQQIGPPREVYDRPANVFVATFFGSPAMNLIPGSIVRQNGAADFVTEAGTRFARLDGGPIPATGERLILGARPENLLLSRAPGDGARGRVEVVERLGDASYLHVACGGVRIVIKESGHAQAEVGDEVGFEIRPSGAQFFEPGTGKALPS